jgi:hypothetical protein
LRVFEEKDLENFKDFQNVQIFWNHDDAALFSTCAVISAGKPLLKL